ncbi:MAG: hypothetical protein KAI47_23705 [Deltaproteobacteria bacterium]|nr:hypothetical protein [Deltaproteobacteria bacterium]
MALAALLLVALIQGGCRLFAGYAPPSKDAAQADAGALGQGCYANNTCDAPLRCVDGRCVIPPTPDLGIDEGVGRDLMADADVTLPPDAGIHYDGARCDARALVWAPGTLTTLAGGSPSGGQDGPLHEARFRAPLGLTVAADGALLVADRDNHRVRRVACGEVTTFAGSGIPGYRNGPVATARFSAPVAVAFVSPDEIYVADAGNRRLRLISHGLVTTFAGSGSQGSRDGSLLSASFSELRALLYDATTATLYIADRGGGRIRRIRRDPQKNVKVVETLVKDLALPTGLAWGASPGMLLVSEAGKHRVVKIDVTDGKVTFVAGDASYAGFADGLVASARFQSPAGLVRLPDGRILVADPFNHALRAIVPEQPKWPAHVVTLVGDPKTMMSGNVDGSLTRARLVAPWGVLAVDGLIILSDVGGYRLRLLALGP